MHPSQATDTNAKDTRMTKIKTVNSGNELVRSTKRFAGCETMEDMKTRLLPKETIGLYTYGGGKQIEVRKVNASGRRVVVATAELA